MKQSFLIKNKSYTEVLMMNFGGFLLVALIFVVLIAAMTIGTIIFLQNILPTDMEV